MYKLPTRYISNQFEHIRAHNKQQFNAFRCSSKPKNPLWSRKVDGMCSLFHQIEWMDADTWSNKKTRANGSDCEESQLSANERCMANKMCLTDIMRNVRNFHPVFMKSFSRQQTDEWNCTSYLQHISIWKYLIEDIEMLWAWRQKNNERRSLDIPGIWWIWDALWLWCLYEKCLIVHVIYNSSVIPGWFSYVFPDARPVLL